jgi:hypothetical protein
LKNFNTNYAVSRLAADGKQGSSFNLMNIGSCFTIDVEMGKEIFANLGVFASLREKRIG